MQVTTTTTKDTKALSMMILSNLRNVRITTALLFGIFKYYFLTGVQSYYGYTLARWNSDSANEEILKIATFTSDTKPLSLECQVRTFFKDVIKFLRFPLLLPDTIY